MKEKSLAKSPPKVKSVEQALSASATEVQQPEKKPRLKRRTSHLRWVRTLTSLLSNGIQVGSRTARRSESRRMVEWYFRLFPSTCRKSINALPVSQMTATFEIPGVQKQDMHVSFRSKHIIVTWRMRNVREKMEDGVLVRDRQEVKHTQFIPLPEGTKVSSE